MAGHAPTPTQAPPLALGRPRPPHHVTRLRVQPALLAAARFLHHGAATAGMSRPAVAAATAAAGAALRGPEHRYDRATEASASITLLATDSFPRTAFSRDELLGLWFVPSTKKILPSPFSALRNHVVFFVPHLFLF